MKYKYLITQAKGFIGIHVAQVNVTGMIKKEIDAEWNKLDSLFPDKKLYVTSLTTCDNEKREFIDNVN